MNTTMLRETFDISFDADAESASLLESAYERFADEARNNRQPEEPMRVAPGESYADIIAQNGPEGT